MAAFDEWLDIDLKNYENFVALKNKNPDVKLIIALGGWTDSQSNSAAYKEMFASPTQRKNFAKYGNSTSLKILLILIALIFFKEKP